MAHSRPPTPDSSSVSLQQREGAQPQLLPIPKTLLPCPLGGCLYSCTHSTRLPRKTRGTPLPRLCPALSTHPPVGPDSWAYRWDTAWQSEQEREFEEVVFTVARQHRGLLSKASLLGSCLSRRDFSKATACLTVVHRAQDSGFQ